MALEGFRLNDLKRWAVFEQVINGYQIKGTLLQEFIDYYNRTPEQIANDKGPDASKYSQIRKDGYTLDESFLRLVIGNNVNRFAKGRINPRFNMGDFQPGGRGLFIEHSRDYLSGLPAQQIKLYEAKGSNLDQNPGWR